jgi:hypothetical protein
MNTVDLQEGDWRQKVVAYLQKGASFEVVNYDETEHRELETLAKKHGFATTVKESHRRVLIPPLA